jgi:fructokinase
MFLVCGEALFDVFMTERRGGTIGFEARLGGSPFNVAIGLARLGAPVTFFGGIAADVLGDEIRMALAREGVQVGIKTPKEYARTTLSLVTIDENGVPNYSFYGDGGADRAVTTADIAYDLEGISAVHVGSYSLVCQPVAETLRELARLMAGKCLVSLDPNVRLNVEPDLAIWRNRIDEWLDIADLVKLSIEDMELLYPHADHEMVIKNWLDRKPEMVVLTRGGEGATAFRKHDKTSVSALKIQVVDTVGAGDSFQAALLSKFGCYSAAEIAALDTEHVRSAVGFAITAAGITCSRMGADLPRLSEVNKP